MKKMNGPSEIRLIRAMAGAVDRFLPLKVMFLDQGTGQLSDDEYPRPDAWIKISWYEKEVTFFVEVKGTASPRSLEDAISQQRRMSGLFNPTGAKPLILLPYLSEKLVSRAIDSKVSLIDPNGNYCLLTDELLAFRLDRPKRYRERRTKRNVYAGDSSLVARFLLREDLVYSSVNQIYESILGLGGTIALSTVSKALSSLAEDLVIQKERGLIRVVQPDTILDELKSNYSDKPLTSRTLYLPDERSQRDQILTDLFGPGNWIWNGGSAAERYAVTNPTAGTKAWIRLNALSDRLDDYAENRFYNCRLEWTDKSWMFFDRQGSWPSRLETYLALSQLDKREQEIAEEIRLDILRPFEHGQ